MQKRTLTVLAIAAFAGAALPFGLPQAAEASVSYDSLVFTTFPIATAGTLVQGTVVSFCVQPKTGGRTGTSVAGSMFLAIDSGLFTPGGAPGGSAAVGTTPLTASGQSFATSSTCTDSAGATFPNGVLVSYTAPNPVPAFGRDLITAASSSTDITSAGQCVNPLPAGEVCNTDVYVFSPVINYVYSVSPIAPSGSLGAGASAPAFTVTGLDASNHSVPGAFIFLSFSSAASPPGGATETDLNGTRTLFVNQPPIRTEANDGSSGPAGTVSITFTAGNPLPPSGDVTVTAQDHLTPSFTPVSDTYAYGVPAPYNPVTPFRICDTRPIAPGIASNQCNHGAAPIGPLTQNQTRTLSVAVGGGVPTSGVTAVVLNVTAINPSKGTFLSLFPAHGSLPTTSNLNPLPGQVIANLVEVGVNSGAVNIYNNVGTVNVAIDIEGYVSLTGPDSDLYNPISPARICDTRSAPGIPTNQCNQGGSHPIVAGAPRTIAVNSGSSVPGSNVAAVVFNLTAIAPSSPTVLRAYPGPSVPNASNLNINAGATLANRVIVPVVCNAGNCTVTIANNVGSVNVAVDIDGWFAASGLPTAKFSGLIPSRICDTRNATSPAPGCSHGLVAAGHAIHINVTGVGGVPALGSSNSPVAVVVNVTATQVSAGTFITVYPGPSSNARPTASDLNVRAGATVTNLVVVMVGPDGTINLFNDLGNVDLIVDVLGYYS